jgi:integrase
MSKRKNANGTGNWYYDEKRKLHIFRITVDYKPLSFSGRTQEIARGKYEDWKKKGSFVSLDSNITVEEYADVWFEGYKPKIEDSTAGTYKYTIKLIQKYFRDISPVKKVKDVLAEHIEDCIEYYAKEYSISQCSKIRAMLGQILRKAKAKHLIDENPVPLADRTNYRRMGKKEKSKKDAFTVFEVPVLMKQLPLTRIGHSIRLMLGTSSSTQELLGLTSLDIDEDGSKVHIRRAVKIKEGGGMYIGDVKAEKRERDIDVPLSARPSAVYLRKNSNGYILKGRNPNMPMHPSTYRDFYKSSMHQVPEVRLLTPHCCRHTYISHLDDNNIDFAVIQALAGQEEKESTISYIHPQSPAISAAVNMIESLLNGSLAETKK